MIQLRMADPEDPSQIGAECTQCDEQWGGEPAWVLEEVSKHVCKSSPKTLNQWVDYIGEWAEKKGWNEKFRDAGEWIALAHTELSEAYEAYRIRGMEALWYEDSPNGPKPEGYATELIDVVIRIFHNLHFLGMDAQNLIEEKMAYNEKRPYRHGNKLA